MTLTQSDAVPVRIAMCTAEGGPNEHWAILSPDDETRCPLWDCQCTPVVFVQEGALLSDEAVERGARATRVHDMCRVRLSGDDWVSMTEDSRQQYRDHARATLTGALAVTSTGNRGDA